ncbi:MAG TPA: ABC transporter ATP-binding protein [Clostridiales bacterium]|nr:ABC transporter ATP-binding protein [Clostridiales bacterium]
MSLRDKIKLTLRGYKTIHTLVPGYLLSMFVNSVASALLPFINIFMSARIISALADGSELRQVLLLVLAAVLMNLITNLITSAMSRISEYHSSKFWQVIDEPLNEKIRQMDYERIEDINVHLMREKIRIAKQTNGLGLPKLVGCFNGIISSFFRVIFSVTLVAGAFTPYKAVNAGSWSFLFDPWFSFVIIVFLITTVILDIFRVSTSTKKQMAVFEGFQKTNRIGNYYYNYLINYKAGKDLKLYALSKSILTDFKGFIEELTKRMDMFQRIAAKYDSIGAVMSTVLSGVIYAFVAVKALFGSFAVGNIVQYVGSLSQFGNGVSQLMSNITTLMLNADSLYDFYKFIDMPDVKYHGTLTTEKRADNEYEIEFHNVSFKYPGTNVYALRNLNLKFNIGKRMAVVGMNGSGKTTMIKLLCRLYDPTEGQITLNGIDIKKYDYKEYMDIFSVVFQDFRLFSFTLGQNVAASVDVDTEKAVKCLRMAGFSERLDVMPKGLDTPLYKDFDEDGVEISGGEAQKIALARALYKDAPFIILDEPTAALDPISEFEVYSKFNEIIGDKTAVYISHRLSSCRFCDDIAVLHEGRLVQRGSHEALIADKSGKYYELWNAQAQHYKEKEAS